VDSLDLLARNITYKNSRETYFIIKLLVDKPLINDAYKAYAYFRWMDDMADDVITDSTERLKFVARQKKLINNAYNGIFIKTKFPEEELILNLIKYNSQKKSLLHSYVVNFYSIIAFDAKRHGKLVTDKQLEWYSNRIGVAVTDCISFFIGNSTSPTPGMAQYKAATAAHIVHMLRDLKEDIPHGFINISKEFLVKNNLNKIDLNKINLDRWLNEKCKVARIYFKEGRKYIKNIPVFRRKLAAWLYCLRFEPFLKKLERSLQK
jgi:phytoene/squalene synthetase